jgi:hypothetical protein
MTVERRREEKTNEEIRMTDDFVMAAGMDRTIPRRMPARANAKIHAILGVVKTS